MTKQQVTILTVLAGLGFVLLNQSCLLFYGTPEFNIPDQTVSPGETLELRIIDYYEDRDNRKDPVFTLHEDSVGKISAGMYTWTRSAEDDKTHEVTIWGSNGLTEDSAVFAIATP